MLSRLVPPLKDYVGWMMDIGMGWDGMVPLECWGSVAARPCCPVVLPLFTSGAVSLQASGLLWKPYKEGQTQSCPAPVGAPALRCGSVLFSGDEGFARSTVPYMGFFPRGDVLFIRMSRICLLRCLQIPSAWPQNCQANPEFICKAQSNLSELPSDFKASANVVSDCPRERRAQKQTQGWTLLPLG